MEDKFFDPIMKLDDFFDSPLNNDLFCNEMDQQSLEVKGEIFDDCKLRRLSGDEFDNQNFFTNSTDSSESLAFLTNST